MATSAAQILANRANAQLSTGPKSPEGKAASAANARVHHGLTCTRLYARDEREQLLLDQLTDTLLNEYLPAGELEYQVFQRILLASWSLERARAAESECHYKAAEKGFSNVFEDEELFKELNRILRYRRQNENSLRAHVKDLQKLQNEREYRTETDGISEDISPLVNVALLRRKSLQHSGHRLKKSRTQFAAEFDPAAIFNPDSPILFGGEPGQSA